MADVEGVTLAIDSDPSTQGVYRGQGVRIVNDNAPSITQLPSELAGFLALKEKRRDDLLQRSIVTKKFFRQREEVLNFYTERLGQQHQSRQYKETYNEFNRSKYKEENKDDPEHFRETISYQIAGTFGEVTEQDNFLAYALATNELDKVALETEREQVQEMIQFFSDPSQHTMNVGIANSERLRWEAKLSEIDEALQHNLFLHEQLELSRKKLLELHRKEIRDGYNLIPKAIEILNQQNNGELSSESAISLAISYRDEILAMKNPLDVFETFIKRQESKREEFRPYIDSMIALFGYDMASANPSRSKEELGGVRDSLFRIEICGQIYDQVGTIGKEIRRLFPPLSTAPSNITEALSQKEQLTVTRELVKATQGTFVSPQQLTRLIDLFYPNGAQDLEVAIFSMNQIIELVRSLPEKFFKDDQSQGQFLTSSQKKLDEFILQEEELAGEAYTEGV